MKIAATAAFVRSMSPLAARWLHLMNRLAGSLMASYDEAELLAFGDLTLAA